MPSPLTVQAAANKVNNIQPITIPGTAVPDLLPAKGVLHDFNAASAKAIDHFIETYQEYYGIPGISMALIKDGKLVYYKTYGYKNFLTKEKVDSNTLFRTASVTKPVIYMCGAESHERGVIDLNKPLYEYLPYPDIAYDERYKLMHSKACAYSSYRFSQPEIDECR